MRKPRATGVGRGAPDENITITEQKPGPPPTGLYIVHDIYTQAPSPVYIMVHVIPIYKMEN